MTSISDRRWRGHVLLLFLVIAGSERSLPHHRRPFAIDAPQRQRAALRHVEENVVVPDDGGGATPFRERQLPGDVRIRRPLEWQICFTADAVQERTSPLGPVLGAQRDD